MAPLVKQDATGQQRRRRRRMIATGGTSSLLWLSAAAAATLTCHATTMATAAFIMPVTTTPRASKLLPIDRIGAHRLRNTLRMRTSHDATVAVLDNGEETSEGKGGEAAGWRRTLQAVVGGLTPLAAAARSAMAAPGAGRIAGRATDIPPPPPPSNERIERSYTPSTRSDSFSFEFGRPSLPRIRIRDGDVLSGSDQVMLNGRPLRGTDVALFGGFVGAALAQNEVRKRAENGGGGGPEVDVHVVAYQLALYDTHGVLAGLQRLARRADTTTSSGLASLASNVCLELLRSYDGWVASKTSSSRFRDLAAAERDFNELSIRERKKWAYENTLEDRAALKSAAKSAKIKNHLHTGKHLMVVTLMVACRRIGGKQYLPKRAGSVEALETSLERFAAALLEKNGRNVIAVDVSWTPDSPDDILSRLELTTKWPELIDF